MLKSLFISRVQPVISKEPFTPGERRAVSALASLYSFRMLGLFMVLPLLGIYTADLPGATPATLGLALGAYGLTQALLQLPLGWLSDRIGRRPVILAGLVAFTLGSLVAADAETIHGIIFGRLLQGCGAIAAALTALAADYTRDSQRTKAMALIGASVGVSFVIALVLGPVLAASGGLSLVFFVTGGLGVMGIGIVALALPEHEAHPGLIQPGRFETEHVLDGGLPILYASIFLLHSVLMATFLVVPGMLVDVIGVAPEGHWWIYLGTVALSLPPALLLMRRGRADGSPRGVIFAAVIALAAGTATALNSTTLAGVFGGMALLFVGINTLEALLPALVSRLAPRVLRGTAMGIFSTCQFLGIFVGGTVSGLVVSMGGVVELSLLISVIAVFWLVLVSRLRVERLNP